MIDLTSAHLETPLGVMFALADAQAVYLLEFSHASRIAQQIARLQTLRPFRTLADSAPTPPLSQLQDELRAYFEGTLRTFQTPVRLIGTARQIQYWEHLRQVPYGETRTYQDLAQDLQRPAAARAFAAANAANRLAVIVPCHRVIGSDGGLRGYGGGIERKQALLEHEKRTATPTT